MSRELQNQLARTYPRIFDDLSFPTFPALCSQACGEDCPRAHCEPHRDTRA